MENVTSTKGSVRCTNRHRSAVVLDTCEVERLDRLIRSQEQDAAALFFFSLFSFLCIGCDVEALDATPWRYPKPPQAGHTGKKLLMRHKETNRKDLGTESAAESIILVPSSDTRSAAGSWNCEVLQSTVKYWGMMTMQFTVLSVCVLSHWNESQTQVLHAACVASRT